MSVAGVSSSKMTTRSTDGKQARTAARAASGCTGRSRP